MIDPTYRTLMSLQSTIYPKLDAVNRNVLLCRFIEQVGLSESSYGMTNDYTAGTKTSIHVLGSNCEMRVTFLATLLNGFKFTISNSSDNGYQVRFDSTSSFLLERLDAGGPAVTLASYNYGATIPLVWHNFTLAVDEDYIAVYWDNVQLFYVKDTTHRLTDWVCKYTPAGSDAYFNNFAMLSNGQIVANGCELDAWASGGPVLSYGGQYIQGTTNWEGWVYGQGFARDDFSIRIVCTVESGHAYFCLLSPDKYRGYLVDLTTTNGEVFRVDAGLSSKTSLGTIGSAPTANMSLQILSTGVVLWDNVGSAALVTSADTTIRRSDWSLYMYGVTGNCKIYGFYPDSVEVGGYSKMLESTNFDVTKMVSSGRCNPRVR